MDYVDYDYYTQQYKGELIDKEDFKHLLERAGEIVEEMCMYRITPNHLQEYDIYIQERVKMAICAQIEYLDANGGGEIDNGGEFQSVSLGKFSYSAGNENGGQRSYAPRALRFLIPTGLLYRG